MFGGFSLICILIDIQPESCAMPSIRMQKFDLKTNECRLRKNIFSSLTHLQKKILEAKMQFAYHRFYNTLIKRIPVECFKVFLIIDKIAFRIINHNSFYLMPTPKLYEDLPETHHLVSNIWRIVSAPSSGRNTLSHQKQ